MRSEFGHLEADLMMFERDLVKIDAISVPPNDKNLRALKMLYGYQIFHKHGAYDNDPSASNAAKSAEPNYG
jgi:hypothetical protein